MTDPNLIPLPAVPRETAAITIGGKTISYSAFYRAALDGKIPVTQGLNGRYHVDRRLLPDIARSLGLPVAADVVSA